MLAAQTLPGQPITMPHQNCQAAGGDHTGDIGRSHAQDYGCSGTFC